MRHRHLNHERYSLAAIDDVIARGRWADWADLRRAMDGGSALVDRIERICRTHVQDPCAQRYHFWMHYVRAHRHRDAA